MNNMNSQTLKKLPPPADRQGEDATLHQSTTVKTSSSDIPFVPMPDSPLPKPASTEEQIQQAAAFLRQMFHPDEWFELTPAVLGRDDKLRPRRNKKNIVQLELSDFTEIADNFRKFVKGATNGMYVSLNPCRSRDELPAASVRDADIVDFRNALVECDDIPMEEQLNRLCGLRLPVRCVVWSGGKSCHIVVAIDAGPDQKLYKKRVKVLYEYLKDMGFPADPTCKNASRLTRLPGAMRGKEVQYLLYNAFGHSSWDDFEKAQGTEAPKPDSTVRRLSYSFDIETNELIESYGSPFPLSRGGIPSGFNQCFFAAYVLRNRALLHDQATGWHEYQPTTGLWERLPDTRMQCVIATDILKFLRDNGCDELEAKRTAKLLQDILTLMNGLADDPVPFRHQKRKLIHVGNGMVEFTETGEVELKPFSPDYRSRNRIAINYDPKAECPRFLNRLLAPAMTGDDIDCLQLYFGQCLLGVNHSQMFLMLTGTAGGGKSTLVNIIEGIIGRQNCTELRLEHMINRFEMNRLIGKTLLTAKDVPSYFMNNKGAQKLKALTGKDTLTTEAKGSNEAVDIVGEFNVIITSNSDLQINVDADNEAWRRRMLWIRYECPPVAERIDAFDELLLREEGAGILNWGIEGARRLLKNKGLIQRSANHSLRVDELLQESDSVAAFIDTCVVRATGESVTSEALYTAYLNFCRAQDWEPKEERRARRGFRSVINAKFQIPYRHDISSGNGYVRRGYVGIKIRS